MGFQKLIGERGPTQFCYKPNNILLKIQTFGKVLKTSQRSEIQNSACDDKVNWRRDGGEQDQGSTRRGAVGCGKYSGNVSLVKLNRRFSFICHIIIIHFFTYILFFLCIKYLKHRDFRNYLKIFKKN